MAIRLGDVTKTNIPNKRPETKEAVEEPGKTKTGGNGFGFISFLLNQSCRVGEHESTLLSMTVILLPRIRYYEY